MKSIAKFIFFIFLIVFLESCSSSRRTTNSGTMPARTPETVTPVQHKPGGNVPAKVINTKNVIADSVVSFAETLQGVRYKYGSMNKDSGLDCSGFINYVFNKFKISVPRTSAAFSNAGTPVPIEKSKRGDLILFTGTDTAGWIVGHMGIITENKSGKLKFIHSASGNNRGVMISELSRYFAMRFVKVIRIFKI
ncbi:hypothetical protein BH09BAC2_BH09BAC2_18980 [soil metagenome]